MRWLSPSLVGILLLFQSVTQAVPFEDTSASLQRLSIRDDYPSDYPYPHKDECTSKVKTEKDKSLFYTGLGGFGLTGKQLRDNKSQNKLHVVGDSFTYPAGFVDPKTNLQILPRRTSTTSVLPTSSARPWQNNLLAKFSFFSTGTLTQTTHQTAPARQLGTARSIQL